MPTYDGPALEAIRKLASKLRKDPSVADEVASAGGKRPYKFRAWHTKDEVMLPGRHLVELILDLANWSKGIDWLEVMEYTGLKDKDGREIYEGDILHIGSERQLYDVKYRCAAFFVERQLHEKLGDGDRGWKFAQLLDLDEFDGDETLKDTEVVGNIYENPKLFEL